MPLFDSLFGDARGAARRAQSTIDAQTAAGRGRIEAASMVLDDRAQAMAADQRGIADAFRALADQPSALERSATAQASRARSQGAARQAALAGGPLNAQRLQIAEMQGLAQAQALMAERSQRLQAQFQYNQAIGDALMKAGQASQSGAAARLGALAEFEQSALNAQAQAAMARAQAESGPSAMGRFLGGAATAAFGIAAQGGFGDPFGVK